MAHTWRAGLGGQETQLGAGGSDSGRGKRRPEPKVASAQSRHCYPRWGEAERSEGSCGCRDVRVQTAQWGFIHG